VAAADSNRWTWLVQWVKSHKQAAAYLGMIGGVVAVLFVWYLWSAGTAERTAGAQLEQARLAVDSRNFGLAASELARLVENYAGTRAAQEGAILLAQVRLAQGQSQLAIDLLKRFAPDAGKAYQAQAYGLLGAAYENAARPKDAAEAYQRAAETARLPFLRGQFLSDAGRAWVAAGDTSRALAAYRAIVQLSDTAGAALEAKVRIGELTRGAGQP
jgi:tetratricopeptide (TPR) repeat protein